MNKKKQTRGISIAVVLIVLLIVMVIGATTAIISINNSRFVNKDKFNTRAFYVAEAGLSRGIAYIKDDPSWDGTTDGTNTFQDVKMPNSDDTFSVRVYNNFSGTLGSPGPAERGIEVPNGSCYIISESKIGGGFQSSKVVGTMLKKGDVFDYGLFSKNGLEFRGTKVTIDAYNSSNQSPPVGNNPITLDGQADAGTNAATAGAVVFKGNGTVDGRIAVGPGADINTVIVPGGHNSLEDVCTEAEVMSNRKTLPEVEIPEGIVWQALPSASSFNDSDTIYIALGDQPIYTDYGILTFESSVRLIKNDNSNAGGNSGGGNSGGGNSGGGGQTTPEVILTPLPEGYGYEAIGGNGNTNFVIKGNGSNPTIFYFKGIDLTGGNTITIDNTGGPVVLYVDGNIKLTGHGATQANLKHKAGSTNPRPYDLRIYGTEKCTEVEMTGNSDAFMAVYAPYATANLRGNSDFYGALVADYINIHGNPAFYYDVTLKDAVDLTVVEVGSYQRF